MKITFSIIIPCFNRLGELIELMKSLESATGISSVEVIIVDDGSTDGTKEYFKKYNSQLDIKIFNQDNRGPGAARNLGMSHARGDYLLFIDSDCTVPRDYFEQIKKALSDYKYDAFGGPDTYREDFSSLLKAINYSMTSFIGTGGTRGSKKSHGNIIKYIKVGCS